MAEITLKDINKSLTEQKDVQETTDKNIKKISDNMAAFLKMVQTQKQQKTETDIESRRKGGEPKTGGLVSSLESKPIIGSIIAFGKNFGLLIAGLMGTLLALMDETFNDIARTLAASSFGITKAIKKLFSPLTGTIVKGYERLVKFLKGGLFKFLMLTPDGKPIPMILQINKSGQMIGKQAGVMTKFFRYLTDIFGTISKFVGGTTFKAISKSLKIFGTVFKILFKPIGIILTLISTIQGAIAGYERGGWVNMITEALGGLISSVVGAPLNLIKDISLWIGGKIGLLSPEDKKKLSEEFDFEKIIMDAGRAIGDWLRGLPAIFDKLLESWGNDIASLFQGSDEPVTDAPLNIDELGQALDAEPRAKGGPVESGKNYIVGENGPEFFKPKVPGTVISNEAMSGMMGNLGKIMGGSMPMAKFGHEQGQKMKAKEDAMRAAGASDMEIAQSMMGDMGGLMSGLKAVAPKIDLKSMSKPDTGGIKDMFKPQNIGGVFGAMVKESEEAKRTQAVQQPAPVIISDNSTRSGGTTNNAMPIQSQPYDFNDPFVKGLRAI